MSEKVFLALVAYRSKNIAFLGTVLVWAAITKYPRLVT